MARLIMEKSDSEFDLFTPTEMKWMGVGLAVLISALLMICQFL